MEHANCHTVFEQYSEDLSGSSSHQIIKALECYQQLYLVIAD